MRLAILVPPGLGVFAPHIPMGWEAVGWNWGWDICKCLLELVLLADSEDRDSLRRHGVTHILSVHNGAKPVLEVSEGHREMLRWHQALAVG